MRTLAIASLLAFAIACSSGGGGGGDPDAGEDAGVPCEALLGGLAVLPDGGSVSQIGLDDAGFTCVASLIVNPAGDRASFSLAPVGALPNGVTGAAATFVRSGGAPEPGNYALGNLVQASASVTLRDGLAFGLQKTGSTTTGIATIDFTDVADSGVAVSGGQHFEVHGSVQATLPYLFGPRPDGGTFDAGTRVTLRATF